MPLDPVDLLSTRQMAAADRWMTDRGTPGAILMDRAGWAVAEQAERMARGSGSILVLAGPGNNGGDGFVAATRLRARGAPVRVALLGAPGDLTGDCAAAARAWPDAVEDARTVSFDGAGLIVDALFGAGLTRPLAGEAADLVARVNASGRPVLAVDVPSGIDGNTGMAGGCAIRAAATVTFFRLKPGHVLQPGRHHCGETLLADIGIDPAVLDTLDVDVRRNVPASWIGTYPVPTTEGHKYTRGHVLVVSGGLTTSGAARMSARAALRVGAGLVTLASPTPALSVNAAHQTAVMLKACDDAPALAEILADRRRNAVVLGPGLGIGEAARTMVREVLRPNAKGEPLRAAVIDADALMSFRADAAGLAALIAEAPGPVVVTPHDGEFEKLFDDPSLAGSRLDRAREGARRLGATMLLKGPDTVVAEPGGRASIAGEDAPWLATAGSGDVLAGLVGGLLAQGMPAFEAASAAVYLHAAAARRIGPGLIAEDLSEAMPGVLADLFALRRSDEIRTNGSA